MSTTLSDLLVSGVLNFIIINPSKAEQNCGRQYSNFFLNYFYEKIRIGTSCELSARKMIHMKY